MTNHAMMKTAADCFIQYRRELVRFALSRSLHLSDAEEAVQSAFLSLCEHEARGLDVDNPRGWLYRVLKSQLTDTSRRTQTRTRLMPEVERRQRSEPTPEALALDCVAKRATLAALRGLPNDERIAVCGWANDMTFDEIAGRLGWRSRQSAHARVHRTLREIGRRVIHARGAR